LEYGILLPPSQIAHLLSSQDLAGKAQARLVRKLCLRALQMVCRGMQISLECGSLLPPSFFVMQDKGASKLAHSKGQKACEYRNQRKPILSLL
jgi:hypothetical protein